MPSDGAKMPAFINDQPLIPKIEEHRQEFVAFEEEKSNFQQSETKASEPLIPRLKELPDRDPFIHQPEEKEGQEHRFPNQQESNLPDRTTDAPLIESLKESGVDKNTFAMPDKQRKDIRPSFEKEKKSDSITDSEGNSSEIKIPALRENDSSVLMADPEASDRESFPSMETEGLAKDKEFVPSMNEATSNSGSDLFQMGGNDNQLGSLIQSIDSLVAALGSQSEDSPDYPRPQFSPAFSQPHQHTGFIMGSGE